MITPSEPPYPENVFRNCKNRSHGLPGTLPGHAEAKVPIGNGKFLTFSEYKKYSGLSDAQRRIARMPRGLRTEKGSLRPEDLDGKDPSRILDEAHAELDSLSDSFFIFYRLLGLLEKEGKYAEAPWHAKSAEEFLGLYVRADDGSPSPRKARMYIRAADTYLQMSLDGVEPPDRVSYLVELAKLPREDRSRVLQQAICNAEGARIGPIIRKLVAASAAQRPAQPKATTPALSAKRAVGELNVTTVWKACEAETQGHDRETKIRFFEQLIATYYGRVRDGLDPFRPIPKCLSNGTAGSSYDGTITLP